MSFAACKFCKTVPCNCNFINNNIIDAEVDLEQFKGREVLPDSEEFKESSQKHQELMDNDEYFQSFLKWFYKRFMEVK